MKFFFALLILVPLLGCGTYEMVPARVSAQNPYSDFPVSLRMDGERVGPEIPTNDSRGFDIEIRVVSDSYSTGPDSPYDQEVTRGFSFENALTGKVLGTEESRCRVGAKIITHFTREKSSNTERVKCWSD